MLFADGIQLFTKLKKKMKGHIMSLEDKILLRKHAIIESINDELKNMCQIEHSRHRSINNFIMNILSALTAYCFFPKKPSLNIRKTDQQQLLLGVAYAKLTLNYNALSPGERPIPYRFFSPFAGNNRTRR